MGGGEREGAKNVIVIFEHPPPKTDAEKRAGNLNSKKGGKNERGQNGGAQERGKGG